MLMGSRPPRRIPNPPFLHAAERPAAPMQVDFSALNLKYPVKTNNPTFVIPRTGWSPKPETLPNLPFMVSRAGESNNFPVYTSFKNGRTRVQTIVKKISGDVNEFKNEVEKVVEQEVEIKSGKLVIEGNYCHRLKLYLLAVGF